LALEFPIEPSVSLKFSSMSVFCDIYILAASKVRLLSEYISCPFSASSTTTGDILPTTKSILEHFVSPEPPYPLYLPAGLSLPSVI